MIEFKNKQQFDEIPQEAFNFNMEGTVTFADGSGEDKKNIRMQLYDGSIVSHWYWGNLAFDLKTMKLAKKKVPILYDHDTDQRVGYSTGASFDGAFILEGRFLDGSLHAEAIQRDIQDGFPFEASLRFDPEKTKIEFIKEGESVEVNGRTLKGPGTLMSNTVIMEGSTCVFGELKNCKSEVFKTNLLKENNMSEPTKTITVETFKADNPDVYKQIFDKGKTEGEASERKIVTDFLKAFGDEPAFCIEQLKSGNTLEEAKDAYVTKLKADKAQAVADAVKAAAAAAKNNPTAARQAFSDEQQAGKQADPNAPQTDEQLKEEFKNSAELQDEFPNGVEAYIAFKHAEKKELVKISSRK